MDPDQLDDVGAELRRDVEQLEVPAGYASGAASRAEQRNVPRARTLVALGLAGNGRRMTELNMARRRGIVMWQAACERLKNALHAAPHMPPMTPE